MYLWACTEGGGSSATTTTLSQKSRKDTIENKRPKYIQLEFNWHQLFKNHSMYKFSQHLTNYELFQILPFGEKLIKVDPARPETNIFHLSNFVYIRKDISREF